MPDFSYAGEFPDRELGDAFRQVRVSDPPVSPSQSWEAWKGIDSADHMVTPQERARDYFVRSGVVITPTVDGQRWQVPGTESFLSADEARVLSLQARAQLGGSVLQA